MRGIAEEVNREIPGNSWRFVLLSPCALKPVPRNYYGCTLCALREDLMLRFCYCLLAVALLVISGIRCDLASAQEDLKGDAEATVRAYEHACEQYDFAKANSMLAPGARWIENSMPEPAEFTGDGWSKRW